MLGKSMEELVFSPSDFVAIVNQTLEYAYPTVSVVGELSNLRVSKNKWVYFDLKDEFASVKFFGTVYQLSGPLEDGLMIKANGIPKLHPLYGFSINLLNLRAMGEGSIKRAAGLLEAKLLKEGLFADSRKRQLAFPPERIGLITSSESAAYADFIKILGERWGGIEVALCDVAVQGEQASTQILEAIEQFNNHSEPVEAIVIIRGGGSADDLAVFNSEKVTRAVAASRIPTLVAVGHETDVSLAELAADLRASTPSNAAELLVPEKKALLLQLAKIKTDLVRLFTDNLNYKRQNCNDRISQIRDLVWQKLSEAKIFTQYKRQLLNAMDPKLSLGRGLVIARDSAGKSIGLGAKIKKGSFINLEFIDSYARAEVKSVRLRSDK